MTKHKKTKSLNPAYNISDITGSIFEFAKAQHKYYSESTANSRAETYQPYKQALKHNEGNLNISKNDMLINSHIIELLNETFKKEVNKNILLQQEAKRYKERISVLTKELDRMKKNKKDKTPRRFGREQLIKFSLLIGFGLVLYSISNYLFI